MTRVDFEKKAEKRALMLSELWQSLVPRFTPTLLRFAEWSNNSLPVCYTAIKAVPKQLLRYPNMTDDQILAYVDTTILKHTKRVTA